jgi:carbamoyltransferase
MYILGISCFFHDSAACLLKDGQPIAAAEEERFTRKKHDSSFPRNAIRFCLAKAGVNASDLAAVIFYEKPLLKAARALQIGRAYEAFGLSSVHNALTHTINQAMFIDAILADELGYTGDLYYSEHHLSHAASAYYITSFEDAAILTVDGVGEWATTTKFRADGPSIQKLSEINYPHSLGMLYSTITAYLGFKVNNDEYKVMGLASYGTPRYRQEFEKVVHINNDASFALELRYFAFMYDSKTMYSDCLIELLGPARHLSDPMEQRHVDIAASLQAVTEEVMLGLVRSCEQEIDSQNLCLAGGVALNCAANSFVRDNSRFKNVAVQPAAGDGGAALGAALYLYHQMAGSRAVRPARYSTCLGPSYEDLEIRSALDAYDVEYDVYDSQEQLCEEVARLISENFILGWFQGAMEFGPRALGNRSILANPCNAAMKDILNVRVKFREDFRPFAPAVIRERAADYFDMDFESPFMLFTPQVRAERAAEIPAVTHFNNTARVQTVAKEDNQIFYSLLEACGRRYGAPIVINTSFNIRGEPIVRKPQDAIHCFLTTDIDYLAIGSFIARKDR